MIELYLTQTVQIHRPTGVDGYGQPVFAAPVTAKARVVENTKRLRSKDGDVVIARAEVILAGNVAINTGDRVTYNGTTDEVLDVQVTPDLGGRPVVKVVYL